jgi:hypothetical protein
MFNHYNVIAIINNETFTLRSNISRRDAEAMLKTINNLTVYMIPSHLEY